MPARSAPRGQRLLVSLLEETAQAEPHRVYALCPRNYQDLSEGFKNITFSDFVKAVNHAAQWLKDTLGSASAPFETFAYQGSNDLRIPLLCVAAAKLDRRILLLSPVALAEAQTHLLKKTQCSAYLHPSNIAAKADLRASSIRDVCVPELEQWMRKDHAESLPYMKKWDDAKHDPWIIFHTTGTTTGLPKPITLTQEMMTWADKVGELRESGVPIANAQLVEARLYTAIPVFHYVGILSVLQLPVFNSTEYVVAPPGPANGHTVGLIIKHAGVSVVIAQPSVIEGLAASDSGVEQLKQLRALYYAGAALRKDLGDQLCQHTTIVSGMGTTEAGGYLQKMRDDKEWDWMTFANQMGIEFERFAEDSDLYELIMRRDPKYERYQQVFSLFPELEVYRTKDLFQKHPDKEDLWKFAGRTDDMLKLSNAYSVNSSKLEEDLMKCSAISEALVGGAGMARPFALIKLANESQQALTDIAWKQIDAVNRTYPEIAQISRQLLLVASPDKPFAMTGKGTTARKQTFDLYAEEISAMYKKYSESQ